MKKREIFFGTIMILCLLANVNFVTSEVETTIQSLIDAASPADTIYLPSGTYYEHLYINKPLTLIGAPTTIDGNGIDVAIEIESTENVTIKNLVVQNAFDGFYLILSHYCIIEENIIQNTTWAITMDDARNQTIRNNVIKNNRYGIAFYGVGNIIIDNKIENSNQYAIRIESCNNTFQDNVFLDNFLGIYVACYSNYNTFFRNTFINSTYTNMQIWLSKNNTIYCNNFFKLGSQVIFEGTAYTNKWDNGTHGNYWSDYSGTDLFSGPFQNITGSDGIGDIPYRMTKNNQDNYPLMEDPQASDSSLQFSQGGSGHRRLVPR